MAICWPTNLPRILWTLRVSTYIYIYIYIYTHTHIYIYIHAHTHCVVAAQMLHVLESETQRYGPNCGAIDLCRGYRVRGLSWTHTTLNAVSSVPTLAFSSTFLPTCYSTCESFDSLMLSITTPLNKSAYKIYAWSSSQATFCPRLRRRWKWESILIFFWESRGRTPKQFLKTYEMFI